MQNLGNSIVQLEGNVLQFGKLFQTLALSFLKSIMDCYRLHH